MQNALGMLEITSISKGIEVGDVMLKAADVALVAAHPVCAGKYIVVVTGEVSDVRASIEAGEECSGMKLVDKLLIPNIDPQVPRAINMCNDFGDDIDAVGSVELFSLCATVAAADAAVKAAAVRLIEIRLARGLGGKGFLTLTGNVSAVESSIKAIEERDEVQGLMSDSIVIPSPHPEIKRVLY